MRQSITFSIELEAALKNLQAVTATTKTEMIGLEKTIREVALTTKFSAVEVAGGALILAQAGLSTKQIAESISAVAMLATASGTTIAEAVDLVTSVVGVFDKSASETADIANKITQAANSSKVSVDKLAAGLQYAGNIASQLGVSFEETTAAMATMANAGIKSGSTMGTGLRQFLNELQKPSQEFISVINSIGLSVSDLDLKANGLVGVARKLSAAGFASKDAIQSFDVRGAAAFNALLARPDDFQRQLDMLHDTQAATKANDVQMESLKNQALRLGNALNDVMASGFAPLGKLLTAVARNAADFLKVLAEYPVVLGAVGTLFATLVTAVMVARIASLVGGLAALKAPLLGVAASLGIVQTAAGGLALTLTATGLGALLVGLSVGAYAIYSAFSDTKDETDKLTGAFNVAKGVVEEKQTAIQSLTNKLEELRLREGDLIGNQKALNGTALDIVGTFGSWGLTLNTNNASLEEMRTKMEALRESMKKMLLQDMAAATFAAGQVADDATNNAASRMDRFRNGFGKNEESSTKRVLQESKAFGLSETQQSTLREFLNEVRAGVPADKMQYSGPAAEALRRASKEEVPTRLKSILETALSGVGDIVRAGNSVRQADRTLNGAEEAQRNTKNYQDANKAFVKPLGKTFEQLVDPIRVLDREAQATMPAEDAKDKIKVHKRAQELFAQAYDELETVNNLMEKLQLDEPTKRAMKDKITNAQGRLRTDLTAIGDFAKGAAKPGDVAQIARLDAEIKAAERRMKPGTLKESDRELVLQNLRDKSAIQFRADTFGMPTNSDKYKGLEAEKDTKLAAEIEAFQDKFQDALRTNMQNSLKIEEASIKRAVAQAERKAKERQGRGNDRMSAEELSALASEGLQELETAYALEKKALAARIAKEKSRGNENISAEMRAAWVDDPETLARGHQDKLNAYVNSYTSLFVSSAEKFYSMTKRIKDAKNSIEKLVEDSERRMYEADQGLREKDGQLATSRGPISSRTVSSVTARLQDREREPLLLAATIRQRDEKQKLMEENQKRQGEAGQSIDLMRAELKQKKATAAGLLGEGDESDLAPKEKVAYDAAIAAVQKLQDNLTTTEGAYNDFGKAAITARDQVGQLDLTVRGLTPGTKQEIRSLDDLKASMEEVWTLYKQVVSDMDISKTLSEGMMGAMEGISGSLATMFSNMASGTQTVKEAFKSMASSVIKSMLDILAQALAMQAIKSLIGVVTGAPMGLPMAGGPSPDILAMAAKTASTGGYFNQKGGLDRVRRFATGGTVTGGISGKDSVPALMMPGEFVLQKPAVDAVGTDFLHSLNNVTNSVVSSSQSPAPNSNSKGGSGVVNVYVVSPDQKPSGMGPKDVVVVISDDIMRGGSIKQLIKQVQMGQA